MPSDFIALNSLLLFGDCYVLVRVGQGLRYIVVKPNTLPRSFARHTEAYLSLQADL